MEQKKYVEWYNKGGYGAGDIAGIARLRWGVSGR